MISPIASTLSHKKRKNWARYCDTRLKELQVITPSATKKDLISIIWQEFVSFQWGVEAEDTFGKNGIDLAVGCKDFGPDLRSFPKKDYENKLLGIKNEEEVELNNFYALNKDNLNKAFPNAPPNFIKKEMKKEFLNMNEHQKRKFLTIKVK